MCPKLRISIHALLAESDDVSVVEYKKAKEFLSTLSLRRATIASDFQHAKPAGFLSTLSLRRATRSLRQLQPALRHFYPRSPCGERHARRASRQQPAGISIHALLAESDSKPKDLKSRRMVFLSTLSLRRATGKSHKHAGSKLVFLSTLSLRRATFNPLKAFIILTFLSTLSLRRATINPASQINLPGYFYPRSPCGERQ